MKRIISGQSHMKIMFLFKETRHPREGGDPGFFNRFAMRTLDPRLRGDDGSPFIGL
ncbi:protein of unknown function (plasmid) [Azospirillum lipoferum 4B]|uniref:Uncharacterized protein n=1 Tax=Azospirillum lipoferum (strain 4B) TaxID=862719 RepID=G7ZHK8_AZOL4|nr:protein of unknown function [Azospirillum lipoferum 4B]